MFRALGPKRLNFFTFKFLLHFKYLAVYLHTCIFFDNKMFWKWAVSIIFYTTLQKLINMVCNYHTTENKCKAGGKRFAHTATEPTVQSLRFMTMKKQYDVLSLGCVKFYQSLKNQTCQNGGSVLKPSTEKTTSITNYAQQMQCSDHKHQSGNTSHVDISSSWLW